MSMSESALPVRVLVVDDDVTVRKLLEEALAVREFVVYPAANCDEAVKMLRHRPDVAVVDVLMPGTDGPQTLRALRAVQPQLPACFFSGYTGRYAESDLLAHGSCTVLNKPCPLGELADVLNRLAGRGS
jgi:CheY-like chemotaxis protein